MSAILSRPQCVSTLRPRQNGRHFTDDTFKRIFLNEKVRILIKTSMKFVPKGPIKITAALVQRMAWRRPGDKPLSEPLMVRLPTHICVTRPQWVNTYIPILTNVISSLQALGFGGLISNLDKISTTWCKFQVALRGTIRYSTSLIYKRVIWET